MSDWRDQAACTTVDMNLFFPSTGSEAMAQVKQAKQVCSTCPVRVECLEYALSFNFNECKGIWGGMSERQRDQIRSARYRTNRDAEIALMRSWS
jgi:WhiB family redox-sensing transcriptional regulator